MKSNSNAFNKFFSKYQCRLFCFCDLGSHVAQACFKLANCPLILGARIPGMCCYADVLRFFPPEFGVQPCTCRRIILPLSYN